MITDGASFVALDLEFVGRRERLPLQLGVVVVEDGEISVRRSFWFKVVGHPWWSVPWGHRSELVKRGPRLTREIYESSPYLADAWATVTGLIADRPVFAHGAGLDMRFLRAGFDAHGLPWPTLRYCCTLSIARSVWPAGAGHCPQCHTLVELARRLFPAAGLFGGYRTVSSGHDPVEDAEAAARVVLAALDATGTSTVAELLAATGRRMWTMDPERCQTSKGWTYRVPAPPSPGRGISDRVALRAAFLEIRREWRADPAILDTLRYPKATDPLPPPSSPPRRRRGRW
ncbi:hypothetical protein [Amycolatopsis sp. NPDC051903]|uniref:hypothetical protein n=1 Tax=Amycolatopsis sp. NPDC051903 TaxID=3363936 RepID=UPI0037B887BA